MRKTGNSFTDKVTWNIVYQWVDCYNDVWMAESRWGFRVKTNINQPDEGI
jgi:hypothetical protein